MPAHLTYNEDTARFILAAIASGVPLAQKCREEGMPDPNTFRSWCDKGLECDGEALAIAYARAREDGFDAIATDAFAIMDETPERYDTEHGDRVDPGFVQHQKNRVEGRLKLLAKWDPKRYGDKLDLTSSDGSMSPKSLAEFYATPDDDR